MHKRKKLKFSHVSEPTQNQFKFSDTFKLTLEFTSIYSKYPVLWVPESKKESYWGKQSRTENLNAIKIILYSSSVRTYCHPSMGNRDKLKALFFLCLVDEFQLISSVLQKISA